MTKDITRRAGHLAFRGLMLSKGYNSKMLAEEIHMSEAKLSDRIRGRIPWRWSEAVQVCRTLGVGLDEFARYFPA